MADDQRRGFDARYGARPLQRALEREIAAPLAHYLLAHPGLSDAELVLDILAGEVSIREGAFQS